MTLPYESDLKVGDLVEYSGQMTVFDGRMVFDETGFILKIGEAWIKGCGYLCSVHWLKTGVVRQCYEITLRKL